MKNLVTYSLKQYFKNIYINPCRLIFRKINGLLKSLNHKCLHKGERKCMSTCVLDKPAVGKGIFFFFVFCCISTYITSLKRIFIYCDTTKIIIAIKEKVTHV